MISKIYTILKSKIYSKYKNKNEEWVLKRREICKECPLNSKNDKSKSIKYRLLNILNFNNDFCTVCGCEIKAKTAEILENCPEEKW